MKRLVLIAALLASPAFAVQPDEVLDDPALESRARGISQQLRCPVCQGENIDDSNAGISRDLRLYVRERLVEGDSDAEVIEAVTSRYGEFVLFNPSKTGGNLVLWLAGPVMALLALLGGWLYIRSRREETGTAPLSADEQAELERILKE
ncbi:MAG: cytochrome c-type biogenesis protein CcmH [Paracoccus sp. (in: a-proteobacteria)]|uniref:cytochrome c-type biogenesis protein n=1 Tax=Paracoccus sp. TaxID=267 RepID=UPI0026E03E1C|nr:cytochrome c-type biogenesis protein [Paracoccus sp. (in: a-proteobacteria)]MDO5622068.1 cytochrome c-type biogenesis protein CcmH [Paracoccus sp. (in: a-proteobacteria)]